eukprot:TRINITY_DN7086_c0_g1_i4.p1 TRINITY_DN7086_c0_g1~~TRINITY_DN7086_c0_g1_i4.p1  ORF type:complete len:2454 (+),score=392.20 TRINITY_DN7086_c0_g1_i4:1006-7362(+)
MELAEGLLFNSDAPSVFFATATHLIEIAEKAPKYQREVAFVVRVRDLEHLEEEPRVFLQFGEPSGSIVAAAIVPEDSFLLVAFGNSSTGSELQLGEVPLFSDGQPKTQPPAGNGLHPLHRLAKNFSWELQMATDPSQYRRNSSALLNLPFFFNPTTESEVELVRLLLERLVPAGGFVELEAAIAVLGSIRPAFELLSIARAVPVRTATLGALANAILNLLPARCVDPKLSVACCGVAAACPEIFLGAPLPVVLDALLRPSVPQDFVFSAPNLPKQQFLSSLLEAAVCPTQTWKMIECFHYAISGLRLSDPLNFDSLNGGSEGGPVTQEAKRRRSIEDSEQGSNSFVTESLPALFNHLIDSSSTNTNESTRSGLKFLRTLVGHHLANWQSLSEANRIAMIATIFGVLREFCKSPNTLMMISLSRAIFEPLATFLCSQDLTIATVNIIVTHLPGAIAAALALGRSQLLRSFSALVGTVTQWCLSRSNPSSAGYIARLRANPVGEFSAEPPQKRSRNSATDFVAISAIQTRCAVRLSPRTAATYAAAEVEIAKLLGLEMFAIVLPGLRRALLESVQQACVTAEDAGQTADAVQLHQSAASRVIENARFCVTHEIEIDSAHIVEFLLGFHDLATLGVSITEWTAATKALSSVCSALAEIFAKRTEAGAVVLARLVGVFAALPRAGDTAWVPAVSKAVTRLFQPLVDDAAGGSPLMLESLLCCICAPAVFLVLDLTQLVVVLPNILAKNRDDLRICTAVTALLGTAAAIGPVGGLATLLTVVEAALELELGAGVCTQLISVAYRVMARLGKQEFDSEERCAALKLAEKILRSLSVEARWVMDQPLLAAVRVVALVLEHISGDVVSLLPLVLDVIGLLLSPKTRDTPPFSTAAAAAPSASQPDTPSSSQRSLQYLMPEFLAPTPHSPAHWPSLLQHEETDFFEEDFGWMDAGIPPASPSLDRRVEPGVAELVLYTSPAVLDKPMHSLANTLEQQLGSHVLQQLWASANAHRDTIPELQNLDSRQVVLSKWLEHSFKTHHCVRICSGPHASLLRHAQNLTENGHIVAIFPEAGARRGPAAAVKTLGNASPAGAAAVLAAALRNHKLLGSVLLIAGTIQTDMRLLGLLAVLGAQSVMPIACPGQPVGVILAGGAIVHGTVLSAQAEQEMAIVVLGSEPSSGEIVRAPFSALAPPGPLQLGFLASKPHSDLLRALCSAAHDGSRRLLIRAGAAEALALLLRQFCLSKAESPLPLSDLVFLSEFPMVRLSEEDDAAMLLESLVRQTALVRQTVALRASIDESEHAVAGPLLPSYVAPHTPGLQFLSRSLCRFLLRSSGDVESAQPLVVSANTHVPDGCKRYFFECAFSELELPVGNSAAAAAAVGVGFLSQRDNFLYLHLCDGRIAAVPWAPGTHSSTGRPSRPEPEFNLPFFRLGQRPEAGPRRSAGNFTVHAADYSSSWSRSRCTVGAGYDLQSGTVWFSCGGRPLPTAFAGVALPLTPVVVVLSAGVVLSVRVAFCAPFEAGMPADFRSSAPNLAAVNMAGPLTTRSFERGSSRGAHSHRDTAQLMQMGYSRESVARALDLSRGNLIAAANWLTEHGHIDAPSGTLGRRSFLQPHAARHPLGSQIPSAIDITRNFGMPGIFSDVSEGVAAVERLVDEHPVVDGDVHLDPRQPLAHQLRMHLASAMRREALHSSVLFSNLIVHGGLVKISAAGPMLDAVGYIVSVDLAAGTATVQIESHGKHTGLVEVPIGHLTQVAVSCGPAQLTAMLAQTSQAAQKVLEESESQVLRAALADVAALIAPLIGDGLLVKLRESPLFRLPLSVRAVACNRAQTTEIALAQHHAFKWFVQDNSIPVALLADGITALAAFCASTLTTVDTAPGQAIKVRGAGALLIASSRRTRSGTVHSQSGMFLSLLKGPEAVAVVFGSAAEVRFSPAVGVSSTAPLAFASAVPTDLGAICATARHLVQLAVLSLAEGDARPAKSLCAGLVAQLAHFLQVSKGPAPVRLEVLPLISALARAEHWWFFSARNRATAHPGTFWTEPAMWRALLDDFVRELDPEIDAADGMPSIYLQATADAAVAFHCLIAASYGPEAQNPGSRSRSERLGTKKNTGRLECCCKFNGSTA